MGVKSKLTGAALALSLGIVGYYEGTKLQSYKDPLGIWTSCTGHTGPEVKAGMRYTPAQCRVILQADLDIAFDTVRRCYPVDRMRDWEVAALVSMGFNMGPGSKGVKDGICILKSGNVPAIRRYFNEGKTVQACNEIPKWANPPLPGIIKRRKDEQLLCLGQVTGFKWQP